MSRPILIPFPKSKLKSRRTEWPDNAAPSRSPGPSFFDIHSLPQSTVPFRKNATNAADQMIDPPSPEAEDSGYAADTSSSSSSEGLSWDVNVNTGKARSTTAISREENWAMDTGLDLHHNRSVERGLPASNSMVMKGVGNTEVKAAEDKIRRSSEVAGVCPPLSRIEGVGSSSSVLAREGKGRGLARRDRLPVFVGEGWMPGNWGGIEVWKK